MQSLPSRLDILAQELKGELRYDSITAAIYSTDASVYKESPIAVVWPKEVSDIRKVIEFAAQEKVGITMRAGGTSLAGQVVSSGIIVDVSRFMNRVIEIDKVNRWVRVEPGVVLDELNSELKKHGLFFGPETSTSNRCNIGGMVGNNACGSHSLVYGSTRDHTLELKTLLSDGSEALFTAIDRKTFDHKCLLDSLEGGIYRNIRSILEDDVNRKSIREEYPDSAIHRRNTGYALDLLLDSDLFDPASERRFNLCSLITGSEGTLAIITEIKLNLVAPPPAHKALLCVHLLFREEAFRANLTVLRHKPVAVEMMDSRILELTEDNLSQRDNRFFLEGRPGAILIVEFAGNTKDEVESSVKAAKDDLRRDGFGYAYPVITGRDIARVWDLRKAGLGILANMKGDAKPVAVIEDTAVGVEQLPDYMAEIERMLAGYKKDAVFHAHIGSGELHLRPVLNLKDPSDVLLFRQIGLDTAHIVKKYRGSLSGEHGDGRLRGEFIPIMIGDHNYQLLRSIKKTWDPENILNPGKITDTPPMNSCLRYNPGRSTREIETFFDFSSCGGIIRASEKCNGSADCRKSVKIGGVMCPSFMATGEEALSTRARANVVREYLNKDGDPWNHREIYEILDLCLACKGCKSECPSGVDMARIKSEYLQHWHDRHHIPFRTLLIGNIATLNMIGSLFPSLYNFCLTNPHISALIKRTAGIASGRSFPPIAGTSLRKWTELHLRKLNPAEPVSTLCLFIDEFTDHNDTETGIAAIKLLTSLGYSIKVVRHKTSARALISKGMIRKARKEIRKNIELFASIIDKKLPLVGIEPSAILGFVDEYPELAGDGLKEKAEKIAENTFLVDEFIAREFREGRIDSRSFTDKPAEILVHAHCQQKALISSESSLTMLSIPVNYKVTEIPSGCCGMAGSFGYEKEHFELSNKIGELVLFPEIRGSSASVIIAAPGTSCRHHILDGTGRTALHPVVVLCNALRASHGSLK